MPMTREQAALMRERRCRFTTCATVPYIRHSPAAGAHVRAWKRGKSVTAAGGRIKMEWCGPELDARGFNRAMMGALDRRINLRGGLTSDGRTGLFRKTDDDYERHERLEVHELRNLLQHRVWPARYRWQTPWLQERYGHLLDRERE